MKKVLEEFYRKKYAAGWQTMVSGAPEAARDGRLLFREKVEGDLDGLLKDYLRAGPFIDLYFRMFLSALSRAHSPSRVVNTLEMMSVGDLGVLCYGDAAYLKIANGVSEDHGDWMLQSIARELRRAKPTLRGRFRTGDEFVLADLENGRLMVALERARERLATLEVVPYLPVSIDIGYAMHSEVARTYLRLLHEGWQQRPKRSAVQVFFDIALRIAKIRSDIQKVHNRGWVLYYHFIMLHSGDRDLDKKQIEANLTELVRGGRFVTPEMSWLEIPEEKFGNYILMRTLAFLGATYSETHFDRVVTEVAESIHVTQE